MKNLGRGCRTYHTAASCISVLTRRSPLIVVVALIPGTNGACARPPASVWTYTMSLRVDSGSAQAYQESVSRQWVDQDRVRMELVKVPRGQAVAEGMYTIVDARDNTLTTGIAGQRTVNVRAIPGIDGTVKEFSPKIHIAYAKHTIDDLGPGEPLLGQVTHRYRITALGTVTASLRGQSCTRHLDVETEIWMAPDVELHAPGLKAMGVFGVSPFTLAPVPPGDSLAASLKGLAMRSVSTSRGVESSDKPVVVTTRTEVTQLRHLATDSMLVVPSDYRVFDMRPTLTADARATAAADRNGRRLALFCRTLGS